MRLSCQCDHTRLVRSPTCLAHRQRPVLVRVTALFPGDRVRWGEGEADQLVVALSEPRDGTIDLTTEADGVVMIISMSAATMVTML